MKIRMCANLLLGAAVPAAPPRQFELPAPSPGLELPPAARFELPPPAQESHAGSASKTSSSMPGPCVTNFFPRDLMDQLDLSDPQEEERFMETYSVPVARQPIMAAGFIKEDEEEKEKVTVDMVHEVVKDAEKEEDMAVAKVNASNLEPCVVPKEVGQNTATKKEDSKPKRNKGKENAEGSNATGGQMYTCKKNDGKKWSCLRPVSQPDTLCSYHSEPRRKRVVALGNAADDEFYYYGGYGPSRYSRRRRGSSSRSVPEPAAPAAVEKEEAQLTEEHGDNKPRCDDKDMDGIAGYVQDTSSDDDDVKKAESSVKKRKKKPVNTRSINSLMLE